MRMASFEYARPETTAEACSLLHQAGAGGHVIAGGTELVLALRNQQKTARVVVDLGAVAGLDRISCSTEAGLRIGPLVTLRRLAEHPDVRAHYPILAQAASMAGSPQLQAMGTVGGNVCQDTCCQYFNRAVESRQTYEPCHKLGGDVCHLVGGSGDCWATYAGDLAPALLALGASISIAGPEGERSLPLRKLYSADGARPNTLRAGYIVTAIHVPPCGPNSRQAYRKLRQRGTLDYGSIGVAVNLEMESDGVTCRDAKVVLTAVDRAPVEVAEAAQFRGGALSHDRVHDLGAAARKAAQPMKNLCDLPPAYRRQMVNVFVEDAVAQAAAGK